MSTCAECLNVLSTTRLSDIERDTAVAAHIDTCSHCSRLVSDMRFAERRLAISLDTSMPAMPPTQIADSAISGSERARRQSVARWIRRGLGFVAAALIAVFLQTSRGEDLIRPDDFRKQTVVLRCLSPQTAVDLATPILRSNRGRIYTARDLKVITIQGRGAEVSEALALIDQLDNPAYCGLPAGSASQATPAVSTPGKD